MLSFLWSATHYLNPDTEGKDLIGSIGALVEGAKGMINVGLMNFFSATGVGE